jgi:hypothetical protein
VRSRKFLASALSVSVAAVPAVAFAASNDGNNNVNTGTKPSTTDGAQLRDDAQHKLRTALTRAKHERKKELKRKARKRAKKRAARAAAQGGGAPQTTQVAGGSTAGAPLQAIAACESGGNPSAVGGGGAFRGKYQFDYGTWASVGGSGDPAAAPVAEQDKRAAMLYARSGSTPWPVCGR